MPKRRQSEGDGGRKARRKPMRPRRRQLFLVLDDWVMGSSIRKIDDPDSCGYLGLQPLPRPIYQLESPNGCATSFVTSLGSTIMIAHPLHTAAQSFDARSRYLIYGPRPHGVPNHRPTFIPFGTNMLCALWGGSLQLCEGAPSGLREQGLWSWSKVQDLPFDESHVTSYGLHPDEQTILVSVEQRRSPWSTDTSATTYFFNMDGSRSNAIDRTVDWSLPFQGRCYFVNELKVWVGLSNSYNSFGHLCSCPLATPDDFTTHKISKENLFSNSQAAVNIGATLVYMGNKEFCLAECIRVNHSYVCEGDPLNPPPSDFLLQLKDKLSHPLLKLTMFYLTFDENGDLTTGNTCRFQYYSMPGSVSRSSIQSPVVFWL